MTEIYKNILLKNIFKVISKKKNPTLKITRVPFKNNQKRKLLGMWKTFAQREIPYTNFFYHGIP